MDVTRRSGMEEGLLLWYVLLRCCILVDGRRRCAGHCRCASAERDACAMLRVASSSLSQIPHRRALQSPPDKKMWDPELQVERIVCTQLFKAQNERWFDDREPRYPLQDCFCPGGTITLEDGTIKPIERVKEGDVIRVEEGFNKVRQVRSAIAHDQYICNVSGVWLTHKHPVKIEGIWQPPKHIAFDTRVLYSGPLYNFVMDGSPGEKKRHTVMVNELICATLGCGPVELAKDYPDSDVTYGNGFWDRPWCKG